KYLRYLLTVTCSASLIAGSAQVVDEQQQAMGGSYEQQRGDRAPVMDSIDIVREYRPMLADAIKVRRSPDMGIDREAIAVELRQIAAATYFERNIFKQAYNDELLKRNPNASRDNIDNYRISYLAYRA